MEWLGKTRHRRKDRRLSEREVSESNLSNEFEDVAASVGIDRMASAVREGAEGQTPLEGSR